jgi:Flp pilus assembly secretin CpaC
MLRTKRSSVEAWRHAAVVAATACFSGFTPLVDAEAADLLVRYDQSQLIRLPRPVSEVIIGNPSIADVTVQGGNLLVVTGKMFGVTNIIALDAQRNVIQDQRVVVEQDDRRTVVLYKGAERETHTCSPTCSPAIIVGDNSKYFEGVAKAAQAKLTGAAVPTAAPGAPQE